MSKGQNTRLNILNKAFELIYTNGYQATSIDDIIATTAVTKGAFYYHFSSKDDMGLSIIEDIIKPVMKEAFILPLQKEIDPTICIYNLFHHLLFQNTFLNPAHGCPVGNLTQEMSPWHAEFSTALEELISSWEQSLAASLNKGKKNGLIRKEVNTNQVVPFVISGYWGVRNLGKLHNSTHYYKMYLKELKKYLDSLKP
jgi:TetR/AcrR family transcriptional regulator, transcriptional repressor for nem operon